MIFLFQIFHWTYFNITIGFKKIDFLEDLVFWIHRLNFFLIYIREIFLFFFPFKFLKWGTSQRGFNYKNFSFLLIRSLVGMMKYHHTISHDRDTHLQLVISHNLYGRHQNGLVSDSLKQKSGNFILWLYVQDTILLEIWMSKDISKITFILQNEENEQE